MSRIYTQYSEQTPVIFAPIPPAGLKLNQIQSSIRLSWEDPVLYEDGFVVERKTTSGLWKTLYFTPFNKGFFDDYGPFEVGEEYTYRVKSYSILANQKYFFSSPSNESSVVYFESTAVSSDSFLIEFGDSAQVTIGLSGSVRARIKDYELNKDYLWFFDKNVISLIDNDSFADIIPIESGSTQVTVKRLDDNEEATLDMIITASSVADNPSYPTSIRGTSVNNSMNDILWNFVASESDCISHFDIYRKKRENNQTKHNLLNYDDMSENKIWSIPYEANKSTFNYRDFGLDSGTRYVYTVIAVNRFGLTSALNGEEIYDYVSNGRYSIIETESSSIDIDPSAALVSPNDSLYLGVVNNSGATILESDWSIEQNNSNSQLDVKEVDFAYYKASDKSVSEDVVSLSVNSDMAKSKVIVTDVV